MFIFAASSLVYYTWIIYSLHKQDGSGVSARLINASKNKNSSVDGSTTENEEAISDNDLDNIVGVANGSELAVLF